MEPTADPAPHTRRWPARLLLGLSLLLHGLLVLYFFPPRVVAGGEPVGAIDYALHQYQADRARQAFEGWGKLWGYDPQVLAGHPAGALEDLTSKGLELFVITLGQLGVNSVLAFNLFILVVHLCVPLLAWLTAWLLGLSPIQRAVATLLWVLLWFFDSLTHWIWYCGMISWAAGTCLALLLVALVFRVVQRGPAWGWIPVALLATLLVTVHPFGSLVAVPACALLYLRRARWLGLWGGAGVALTIALPVAVSSIWLTTAARMWHYVDELTNFLKPSAATLLWDFLDITEDPWDTGLAPVRTLLRFLCLTAGGVVLWRWRKQRDPRLLPLGLVLGMGLVLAYGGGLLEATSKVQPYRLMMPATLVAAFPAALLLCELLSPAALRKLGRPARLLLLLLAVMTLPRMVRTVIVNMPDPLPAPHRLLPGSTHLDARQEPLSGLFAFRPAPLRHLGSDPNHKKLRDWLKKYHRGRGRVLVQDWILGEYLAWATRIPLLGGLEQRAIHQADAHLFRHHQDGNLPGRALRDYLERYAVGLVVIRAPVLEKVTLPALEWRKDLLHFVTVVGGYRIYLTKINPSYFLRGKGRVVGQAFNSIRVEGASGDDVVLRFHWLETLRCRPHCEVQRFSIKGDRVGFIRVVRPPPKFEIYNAYNL